MLIFNSTEPCSVSASPGLLSLHLPDHPTSWNSYLLLLPILGWISNHHPSRQGHLYSNESWQLPPKYSDGRKASDLFGQCVLSGLLYIIHVEFPQTKFATRLLSQNFKMLHVSWRCRMHSMRKNLLHLFHFTSYSLNSFVKHRGFGVLFGVLFVRVLFVYLHLSSNTIDFS